MLQAQSPRLHIEIATPFPLQRPWMVGLFANPTESYKSGILLLELGLQVGAGTCATYRRIEAVDQNSERVALQSRIQVIILRGPMINAEAGAHYCLSMKHSGSPSQRQSRIEIHVTGVVQARVRGARSRINGAGARSYVE